MKGFGKVEAKVFRFVAAAPVRGDRGLAHCGVTGRRARAAGFTYIGVLVLVAMMGMALALASELWHTAQKREKEQELLFIGNQFRRAIAMYSANGGGNLQRLEDLLKDPRIPGVRRYLRKIYRDPMTGSTEWGLVKSGGDVITGVYSLSGDEPLKQAGFNATDSEFEGKKKYSDWVFVPKPAPGRPGATAPAPGIAGAIPPAQGTASAPATAQSGAAQNDTTVNRSQVRVRR